MKKNEKKTTGSQNWTWNQNLFFLGEEPEQNPNPRFLVKVENRRPTLVW
jgi:hypothetical protein